MEKFTDLITTVVEMVRNRPKDNLVHYYYDAMVDDQVLEAFNKI